MSKKWMMVSGYLFFSVMPVLSACTALPDTQQIVRESKADITPSVQVNGIVNPRTSEKLLERAAGKTGDEEQIKQLTQAVEAVVGRPLIAGNRVELLVDGPASYRSMFDAMRQARDHIHFETYILRDDEVGREFAAILIDRRASGVEVKVIYDSLGSVKSDTAYFERLRAHGVQVLEFHPIDPTDDIRVWRFNHRDHRKILVVDGAVAFTGGINISDVYSSSSLSRKPKKVPRLEDGWRDTQVRITGPAVAEFQKLFLEIWTQKAEAGATLVDQEQHNYFPQAQSTGQDLVRVVASTGGDDESQIYEMYVAAITHAKERVWVTQAYFSPDDQFLDILKQAARRGVDVRILLPGFTDISILLYGSRAHYTELLEEGIKLYERNDALLHAKTAVIDGIWATVGSSNLDYRSFLHNNEANAVIVGRRFGQQMEQLFLSDQARAENIELAKWRERPLRLRFLEQFGSWFDYWL